MSFTRSGCRGTIVGVKDDGSPILIGPQGVKGLTSQEALSAALLGLVAEQRGQGGDRSRVIATLPRSRGSARSPSSARTCTPTRGAFGHSLDEIVRGLSTWQFEADMTAAAATGEGKRLLCAGGLWPRRPCRAHDLRPAGGAALPAQ